MTQIATRAKRFSDVFKYEQAMEHGFSRKTVTVTLSPTSALGDVLADPGDGSAFDLVTVATTSNELAIIADAHIEDLVPSTGTVEAEVAVIYQNAVAVDKELVYGADVDTEAEVAAVVAQFESQGIKVGAGV